MNRIETLVEKKIREAMEAGEFDNLPGKGQPVDLSENPFVDPAMRVVHKLLRDAGFAPPWIEERKDIEAELEKARTLLLRGRKLYVEQSSAEWDRVTREFRVTVEELNARIRIYNLKVPAAVFQRNIIDADRELTETAGVPPAPSAKRSEAE